MPDTTQLSRESITSLTSTARFEISKVLLPTAEPNGARSEQAVANQERIGIHLVVEGILVPVSLSVAFRVTDQAPLVAVRLHKSEKTWLKSMAHIRSIFGPLNKIKPPFKLSYLSVFPSIRHQGIGRTNIYGRDSGRQG